jgi:hypothetical protein
MLAATVCVAADGAHAGALPPDRGTVWNPGLNALGGIPKRVTRCARLEPAGGHRDDHPAIQAAIDSCPVGQIVELSAGTFNLVGGKVLLLQKGITLRGAGPGRTILTKPDGAQPGRMTPGATPSPLVVIGPGRWGATSAPNDVVASARLTADAVKGADTVIVDRPEIFAPGQFVLLDEASNAAWQPDRLRGGRVWASPDFRIVWRKHDPPLRYVDTFAADVAPMQPGSPGQWFSRLDRPTSEIKEVAAVQGHRVRFTTPIHISYRMGHAAELSRYARPFVVGASLEDLTMTGGDDASLRIQWVAASWARNVEITSWLGEGVAIANAFRIELREFYVHDAVWPEPGGGGYGLSLSHGASEVLIENGIVVRANKLIVARSAGAGSVVAYNYMDMAFIRSNPQWIETGLNASHMVGSHHVLFEGNLGHNAESDNTHGNSIHMTFHRNHLRCVRGRFEHPTAGAVDDATSHRSSPRRCVGLMTHSYDMTFIGNVLGEAGRMQRFVQETTFASGKPGIWMLGWDTVAPYPVDVRVRETLLRHGNFDFLSEAIAWDESLSGRDIPSSLYLKSRPPFFDAGRGYAWPWVEPTAAPRVHVLPAKARFDAGTPFVQP